jgi:hypothetical protein
MLLQYRKYNIRVEMCPSGLYHIHKHITIVNDDSSIVNKFEASLTDNARVVNYNCHMFIARTTGLTTISLNAQRHFYHCFILVGKALGL